MADSSSPYIGLLYQLQQLDDKIEASLKHLQEAALEERRLEEHRHKRRLADYQFQIRQMEVVVAERAEEVRREREGLGRFKRDVTAAKRALAATLGELRELAEAERLLQRNNSELRRYGRELERCRREISHLEKEYANLEATAHDASPEIAGFKLLLTRLWRPGYLKKQRQLEAQREEAHRLVEKQRQEAVRRMETLRNEQASVKARQATATERVRDSMGRVREKEEDVVTCERDAQVARAQVQRARAGLERARRSRESKQAAVGAALQKLNAARTRLDVAKRSPPKAHSGTSRIDIIERDLRAQPRRLQLQREQLLAKLGDVAPAYEDARLATRGAVLAEMRGATCGACGSDLPPSTVVSAATSTGIVQCPTCRRILYVRRTDVRTSVQPVQATKKLVWEILPPGWWRDASYMQKVREEAERRGIHLDLERLQHLAALSPKATYEGSYMGRRQYIVFEFERVAIAECWVSGNALYYTTIPGWQNVFVLTKRQALRVGARRLIHRGDWMARVRALTASRG